MTLLCLGFGLVGIDRFMIMPLFPVMAQEPTVKNCWAPEIVFNEAKGEFLIFWASTIPGRFPETASQVEGGNNHRQPARCLAR